VKISSNRKTCEYTSNESIDKTREGTYDPRQAAATNQSFLKKLKIDRC